MELAPNVRTAVVELFRKAIKKRHAQTGAPGLVNPNRFLDSRPLNIGPPPSGAH